MSWLEAAAATTGEPPFPKEPQSLDESTTMGSAPGSISASIMEIFRMSDTDGFSGATLGPELDSGRSLAAASALLLTGGEGWLPKVIFVTVAPCVMIGCWIYPRRRTWRSYTTEQSSEHEGRVSSQGYIISNGKRNIFISHSKRYKNKLLETK